MSVTIYTIRPDGEAPLFEGFAVTGATQGSNQNVLIFYEIPANGVQSANLTAVSDADGHWAVSFAGAFRQGTEITAIARSRNESLARLTKTL